MLKDILNSKTWILSFTVNRRVSKQRKHDLYDRKFFILINLLIKLLLWFTSTNFIFFLWALSKVFYNTPSVCLNSFSYKGIASSQYKNIFLILHQSWEKKKSFLKNIFLKEKTTCDLYISKSCNGPLYWPLTGDHFLQGFLVTPHSPTSPLLHPNVLG